MIKLAQWSSVEDDAIRNYYPKGGLPVVSAMIGELVLPWPSRDLHPNARVHWGRRARAAKKARECAYLITKQAGWRPVSGRRINLWIDFYPPDKRRRDDDGLLSAFKPWRDGIADAMGVDDSVFVSHPYVQDKTYKGGFVIVRISQPPGYVGDD